MKYLPDITFREGMQIGMSLGTAIFVFMTGTFMASALTRGIVGDPANNDSVSLVGAAQDTWLVAHAPADDARVKTVEFPQSIADDVAARALEATRWMVLQELRKTIRNSLPTAVASADSPVDRNMESIEVVADKSGASVFYTGREMEYDQLKDSVKKMLDARLQEQLPENPGNYYDEELVEENMQLTAGKNADVALAVTNGDVVRNLNRSVRQMILSPLKTDSVTEIAQKEPKSYHPATRRSATPSYTWVSWNSADE